MKKTITIFGSLADTPKTGYSRSGQPIAQFKLVAHYETGQETISVLLTGKDVGLIDELEKGALLQIEGKMQQQWYRSSRGSIECMDRFIGHQALILEELFHWQTEHKREAFA
ncbi:single-stranded DNA-binding protein [Dongshaea marina]|uniref:single-stranded DNA-binding protein n=1 Tax=Dongshaea marina TaxID=2047966 RepID=UPI000D3EAD14|nr:single-stranded DNA-binding protein [Dongshaea marina]